MYAEARELIPCLARAHKRRLRRGYSRRHTKAPIPNRIPLSERPVKANCRREAGQWETDTAVSRQSLVAIQISAECKTRYSKLAKLPRKSAEAMRQAQVRRFS